MTSLGVRKLKLRWTPGASSAEIEQRCSASARALVLRWALRQKHRRVFVVSDAARDLGVLVLPHADNTKLLASCVYDNAVDGRTETKESLLLQAFEAFNLHHSLVPPHLYVVVSVASGAQSPDEEMVRAAKYEPSGLDVTDAGLTWFRRDTVARYTLGTIIDVAE